MSIVSKTKELFVNYIKRFKPEEDINFNGE